MDSGSHEGKNAVAFGQVASKTRLSAKRVGVVAGAAFALVLGWTRPAAAGPMDPTPERLVLQPGGLPANQTCGSIAQNPELAVGAGSRPNDLACRPNNVAFRNMMSELGFAMAPTSFYPARTTGLGGFALTLEASFTHINADKSVDNPDGTKTQYWHLGTRGKTDPNTKSFQGTNDEPDSLLQIYMLKARKGLPLGFEIVGALGFMANTTMWVMGGDVRWALMEGFRAGPLGLLPDISVGAGVRTMAGNPKFYLTTVGLDVKASKPINLADSATLTPGIGYQRLIVFADSNVVDLTPNVDALRECGYSGANPETGAPLCNNKLSNGTDNNGDFNNNVSFDKVRIHRHRALASVNYRHEYIYLGGQFAIDITEPKDENPNIVGGRQWTLSLEAGTFF